MEKVIEFVLEFELYLGFFYLDFVTNLKILWFVKSFFGLFFGDLGVLEPIYNILKFCG